MVLLSLLWIALGLLIGLLACAARLDPHQQTIWAPGSMLVALIYGGILTLAGGWLGTLLIGRLFATTTAVWIGIVGVWLLLQGRKALSWLYSLGGTGASCPEEK